MIDRHRISQLTLYFLLLTGTGLLALPSLAESPGGAVIENTATGSFDDPFAPTGSPVSIPIQSNTVRVTVAEVAGITAVTGSPPQELTIAAAGAAAGTWQNDGNFNTGDVVYFQFVLTNTGNDPTQFFIPGTVGLVGGTLQGSVEVTEIDPDGSGSAAAITLPSNPIAVPSSGATTAALLTTLGNPTGLPNGSLPMGATVKVRVPVKITANPGTGAVQVVLGDTGSNDNSSLTQNQPFIVSATAGRDLYTTDNGDGAVTNEAIGHPINGDSINYRQESSASQSLDIKAVVSGQVWNDANASLTIDAIGGSTVLESGTNAGSTNLTVYAINPTNNRIIAKSPVTTGGIYSLTLTAGNNYKLWLIDNSTLAVGSVATGPSLPSAYLNTGENFAGSTETTTPGEISISNLANNLIDYNFGVRQSNSCTIASGTVDPNVQSYISTEAGNTSVAAATLNNLRTFANGMDDTWRVAAGGIANGTATPWFGRSSTPGSATSFIYKEPGSSTAISTTVTALRIPFNTAIFCNGGTAYNSTAGLAFGDSLQDGGPRPSSLFTSGNQPGFWENTSSAGTSSRSAVRFTFSQPVKSFGAWFSDLETRTVSGGVPAYLRLIDGNGDRIGQDIAITPQTIYDGVGTTQALTQSSCGSAVVGCGNKSTRWIGFIDQVATARVKEVVVIVGDDDPTGNGTDELLSFTGANYQNIPNLLLVKRITRVNDSTTTSDGISTLDYINETSNPYDDNQVTVPVGSPGNPPDTDRWPVNTNNLPLLAGATNGGKIQPGKEIEYTIYFLSTGEGGAKNVVLCDRVPDHQAFSPNAFGAVLNGATGNFRGMQISLNGIVTNQTNVQDSDLGTYYPPGASLPAVCGTASNSQGAIVVNLGDLPTASVNATAAYGYVRFRTRTE
jgi:hypothetical protein